MSAGYLLRTCCCLPPATTAFTCWRSSACPATRLTRTVPLLPATVAAQASLASAALVRFYSGDNVPDACCRIWFYRACGKTRWLGHGKCATRLHDGGRNANAAFLLHGKTFGWRSRWWLPSAYAAMRFFLRCLVACSWSFDSMCLAQPVHYRLPTILMPALRLFTFHHAYFLPDSTGSFSYILPPSPCWVCSFACSIPFPLLDSTVLTPCSRPVCAWE
ncbi:hypothetical protein NPIL_294101 [Nephila pilipes]|uniref:Uncharacterized protein n=1 Tax=Nephila pilipes TaxID=299642 RepID=A0A8X6PEB0_NEPPI|nr:hypothetical protein NPIL_294101 [Nephila pilipes]